MNLSLLLNNKPFRYRLEYQLLLKYQKFNMATARKKSIYIKVFGINMSNKEKNLNGMSLSVKYDNSIISTFCGNKMFIVYS